jgi:RimJ/RimL family protein N-acetyltransferase
MTDIIEQPARALTAGVHVPERIELPDHGFHLQRSVPDDVQQLHDAVVASFAEVHPWMPWCTEPVDIADQRAHLERAIVHWDEAVSFNFSVIGTDGRFSGSISLMDRIGPGGLEIGYWLRTDATGRGVMTAATRALTEVALALPGITRVEIHCDAANLRSAAVPRRLGFRLEHEVERAIAAPGESGVEQRWTTP